MRPGNRTGAFAIYPIIITIFVIMRIILVYVFINFHKNYKIILMLKNKQK